VGQHLGDFLELFIVNIIKKMNGDEELEQFISQLENKAVESKMMITDLKELFENNGIAIREHTYD
jgi:hypothetical protein